MSLSSPKLFIGLMSGTSFDGIDVAALETDGRQVSKTGPARTWPWPEDMRARLRAVMGQRHAPQNLTTDLTDCHKDATISFLNDHGIQPSQVEAVGFHGQTIFHAPAKKQTVQLGDGLRLAQGLGMTVIDQFRIDDVQAGGEGAPLAPVYHAALFSDLERPLAVVNIGGLSNITWIGQDELLSFDAGIGNARLDDWIFEQVGLPYDPDGEYGARGKVNEATVASTLKQPFYLRLPPKSLDRDELSVELPAQIGLEDGAATLAAITADAISASARFFPQPVHNWIIAGGGRRNQAIMRRLQDRLTQPVMTAEDAGQDGDGIEAHLIAFLAARRLARLPSTYATTTGASRPIICGRVHSPNTC